MTKKKKAKKEERTPEMVEKEYRQSLQKISGLNDTIKVLSYDVYVSEEHLKAYKEKIEELKDEKLNDLITLENRTALKNRIKKERSIYNKKSKELDSVKKEKRENERKFYSLKKELYPQELNPLNLSDLDVKGLFRCFGLYANQVIFTLSGKRNKLVDLYNPNSYRYLKSSTDFHFSTGTPIVDKKGLVNVYDHKLKKTVPVTLEDARKSFGVKRNQRNLEYNHVIAVDIDNTGLRGKRVTGRLLSLKNAKIIGDFINMKIEEEWVENYKAHVINFTGNGIQMIWAVNHFDPNNKKITQLATDLTHYFNDFIQEKLDEFQEFLDFNNLILEVDRSINTKSQLLRLPGSINSKYGVKAETMYVDSGSDRLDMGKAISEIRLIEQPKAKRLLEEKIEKGEEYDSFLVRKANAGSGKEWTNFKKKKKKGYTNLEIKDMLNGRIRELVIYLEDKGKGVRFNTYTSIISTMIFLGKGTENIVNSVEKIDEKTGVSFYKNEENIRGHVRHLQKYWADKPWRLRSETIMKKSGIDEEYAKEKGFIYLRSRNANSATEKERENKRLNKRNKDRNIYSMLQKGFDRKEVAEKYGVAPATVDSAAERHEKRKSKIKERLIRMINALIGTEGKCSGSSDYIKKYIEKLIYICPRKELISYMEKYNWRNYKEQIYAAPKIFIEKNIMSFNEYTYNL